MLHRENLDGLKSQILDTRRLWKRTIFWTGLAIVTVFFIGLLFGGALIDLFLPLPSIIRILLLVGLISSVGFLCFKHIIKRHFAPMTLRDIALKVEERHPELEDRLVSAIQFGDRPTDDPMQAHMINRLVTDAVEESKSIDFKATVDKRQKNKRVAAAFLAFLICGLTVITFPNQTETALRRIFTPWKKTDPILTTKLAVKPGKARILRGQSLPIEVEITGKKADQATIIYTRLDPNQTDVLIEKKIKMVPFETQENYFGYEIFNVDHEMKYYIVVNETESEHFTVKVFDVPKVEDIEISYSFPAYTKMKPVIQRGNGDIRAIVGTEATVRIMPNKPIQTATIQIGGNEQKSMQIDELITYQAEILENTKYTVDLFCIDGFKNQIPIEYEIIAIPDKKPEVAIKNPGRDIKATKLEEVSVTAEATDDFGLAELDLTYSVGSSANRQLPIETSLTETDKNISRSYTFYLEEIDIEPGDVISYFAEATDNNTRTGPGKATSQIYFIEVKPFNERYEEMDSQGESQDENSPAVKLMAKLAGGQKQIIRETWKHINSQTDKISGEYTSEVKKTAKKQEKLKDQVQRAVDEIGAFMQEGSVDPEILMLLEQAIDKMGEAVGNLGRIEPKPALPAEQDALELVVKAIMKLQKVLTQMQSSENQQIAEDLEVELEDLDNQFAEDQQQLEQEMREQTQELLEEAREVLEQQQNLNQQGQQMGRENQPSRRQMQQNSQQQQQLAQQTHQMAQQAQKMANQQSGGPQSNRSQKRLEQAAQSMRGASQSQRKSADSLERQKPQASTAKGTQATEQLEEAIDQLEKVAAQFTDQALADATEKVSQMINQQSQVRSQTTEVKEDMEQNGSTSENRQQVTDLSRQQRSLQQDLQGLQQNLTDLQEELNRQGNSQAERNVASANRRLIEDQTEQDMTDAERALRWRNLEYAERNQQEVLESLEQTRDQLLQAQLSMAQTEEERLEATLEQLERWENRVEDTRRELEAMDQQPAQAQQKRQEQLSEQQKQIRENVKQKSVASKTATDGEYEELWLGLLKSLTPSRGGRNVAFPDFDLALTDINKLKQALENRLLEIQQAKKLARVAKEDVPPEYRSVVNQYYESLAQ